jgi:subtilisin family serine protease
MKTVRMFLVLSLLFVYAGNIAGQNKLLEEIRNLPPVDLSKLTPDAYYKDRLFIKIKPEIYDMLPDAVITATENGYVNTGIRSLDNLNGLYKVHTYIPHIESIHYPGFNRDDFLAKIKPYELHLWIELECDTTTNIIQAVKSFMALAEVEKAEPVYIKRRVRSPTADQLPEVINRITENSDWVPNDPYYNEQWSLDKIDMPQAWDIEKGKSDVIVAILDFGIQYDHPDIAGNMWSGIGYNFVNNSSTINPDDWTTHYAGTISAVSNNGIGIAGIAGGSGSANGVKLMSCQVVKPDYTIKNFPSAVAYAAENGAAIILRWVLKIHIFCFDFKKSQNPLTIF